MNEEPEDEVRRVRQGAAVAFHEYRKALMPLEVAQIAPRIPRVSSPPLRCSVTERSCSLRTLEASSASSRNSLRSAVNWACCSAASLV